MKIALDPYMLRHVPLTELPAVVAGLGYEYIERWRNCCRSSSGKGSSCGSSRTRTTSWRMAAPPWT